MNKSEDDKKIQEEINRINRLKDLDEDLKEVLRNQIYEKYGIKKSQSQICINYGQNTGVIGSNSNQSMNSPTGKNIIVGDLVGGNIVNSSNGIVSSIIKSENNSNQNTTFSSTNNSNTTNVDNREGVMQRSNIGNSSDKTFSKCPCCGEGLNLPKTPKLCPHCGEQMKI